MRNDTEWIPKVARLNLSIGRVQDELKGLLETKVVKEN